MADEIERRFDIVDAKIKEAYDERRSLQKTLNDMRDRSADRVDEIMHKVSEKADKIQQEFMKKVTGIAEGVSMKVFMWSMRLVVIVLVGYGSWLLAMHSGMKDLGTNIQLIQKDMEYTKEAIVKIERVINNKEYKIHRD